MSALSFWLALIGGALFGAGVAATWFANKFDKLVEMFEEERVSTPPGARSFSAN